MARVPLPSRWPAGQNVGTVEQPTGMRLTVKAPLGSRSDTVSPGQPADDSLPNAVTRPAKSFSPHGRIMQSRAETALSRHETSHRLRILTLAATMSGILGILVNADRDSAEAAADNPPGTAEAIEQKFVDLRKSLNSGGRIVPPNRSHRSKAICVPDHCGGSS